MADHSSIDFLPVQIEQRQLAAGLAQATPQVNKLRHCRKISFQLVVIQWKSVKFTRFGARDVAIDQHGLRPPLTLPLNEPLEGHDTPTACKTKKNQVVIAVSCDNHLIWWVNPGPEPSR